MDIHNFTFLLNSLPPSALSSIFSFLHFTDILNFSNTNHTCRNLINNNKIIKHFITNGCLNYKHRKLFYFYYINVKLIKDKLIAQFAYLKLELNHSNIYQILKNKSAEDRELKLSYNNKFAPFDITSDFQLDFDKISKKNFFQRQQGKQKLSDMIMLINFIRPEVVISNSLNFIICTYLSALGNEELSLYIILYIIDNFDINLLFLTQMPEFSIAIFQMNYFLKQYMPSLHSHFVQNKITNISLYSKFIKTLFTSYLPQEISLKILDTFIVQKWKLVYKVSLCFLSEIFDKIIKMDIQATNKYLKEHSYNFQTSYKQILSALPTYKITNKKLNEVREEYFISEVKKKLDIIDSQWDDDQIEFVVSYQNQIAELESQSNLKTQNLNEELEMANKEYEATNKEVEEQKNVCDEIKIKIQVLIEMLSAHEKILKATEKEVKKKEKLAEYKNLDKKYQKTKADLTTINAKFMKNLEILDHLKYKKEKKEQHKQKLIQLIDKANFELETKKKTLLRNLSERLKLSIRFVRTSKY